MSNYTAQSGIIVTDGMIDQWDSDADAGIYHGAAGPVTTRSQFGRPRLFDEPMEAVTFRAAQSEVEQADALAKQQQVSRSTMLRELLTLGLQAKLQQTAG